MLEKDKYLRLGDESEEDYKIRICSYRLPDRLRWDEIAHILNRELGFDYSESKYRKEYALYLRGRKDASDEKSFLSEEKKEKEQGYEYTQEDVEMREHYQGLTERVPYYRLMKQDARFERFYTKIAEEIRRLPVPQKMFMEPQMAWEQEHEFCMTLADLHIGACFDTIRNSYSMDIAKSRFEIILNRVACFVNKHQINTLKILSLGDMIQGMLRISDLKLNEAPVVDALVFVMRLLANFLNELSKYCNIEFLQVLYSNHDQLRPLGTKASELAAEDMGKIVYAYLRDTLANNPRIKISGDTEHDFLKFNIFDFNCIALHGHQINNLSNALKDLSNRHKVFFDYVFLGHTHSAREIIASDGEHHDMEILTAPSVVGVDPYAQKLMVGSKAAVKIFEFDKVEGHVASYKIVLN